MTDKCQNQGGDHIVRHKNIESLYCTPYTNITNTILYTNYTEKKWLNGKSYVSYILPQ